MTEKQQPMPRDVQLPKELAIQVSLLNARIANTDLAIADLLKEVNNVFTAMMTKINTLETENAKLKPINNNQ